ncbi:MAG: hypothetical protein OSA95_13660, partial [Opitutales bacterium]|nr:hypothetical protein [Opitutales bacterium]
KILSIPIRKRPSFFRPLDRCGFAFAGDFNGATGSLQTFKASIGGAKPWLLAGIPKEVHFHKGKDGHWETDRTDSLFELETRELDPVRFGAFHPKMDLKIAPMDSRWLLSLEADESIVLRAKQPVSLKDVSFAWEGTTYVHGEEFRGNPVLRFADGFFLQAPDLKLGGLENPLATGSFLFKDFEGEQKWGGEFEVLLPRLSQTVLFKDKGAVVSGSAVIKVGPMDLGTRMDVQLKDVALRDRENEKVSGVASLLWPEKTTGGESFRSSFELKDEARNSRGTIVVGPQDHYDFNADAAEVLAANAGVCNQRLSCLCWEWKFG